MPEFAKDKLSTRTPVDPRETYRYSTVPLDVEARPIDAFVQPERSPLGNILDALKLGQGALGAYTQYKTAANKEDQEKATADQARGTKDPSGSLAYIRKWEELQGQADSVKYHGELTQFTHENKNLPPDEFEKGVQQIRDKYILGASDNHLRGFTQFAMKSESWAEGTYRTHLGDEAFQQSKNAAGTMMVGAFSQAQSSPERAALVKEWQQKYAAGPTAMFTKDQVNSMALAAAFDQGLRSHDPTALDWADIPDASGYSISATGSQELRSQLQQHKQFLLRDSEKYNNDMTRKKQMEREDTAYQYAWQKYGLNYDSSTPQDFHQAYAFLMDPGNSEVTGLKSVEERTKVANAIYAEGQKIQAEQDRKQKQADSAFLLDAHGGKFKPSEANQWVDQNSGLRPTAGALEKAADMFTKDEKWLNHTERAVWNDTFSKINKKEITDVSELPAAGNGLSISDVKYFAGILQTKNDAMKDRWFTQAISAWDKRYELEYDAMSASEKDGARTAFILNLNQRIQDKNLAGSDILEAANKIMRDHDEAEGIKLKPLPVINNKPGAVDTLKGWLGMGSSKDELQSTKSEPKRRPLPAPPEIVGTHKRLGVPVYRQVDGTLTIDPAGNSETPQMVGLHKDTGLPVYRMPDNTYVTLPEPESLDPSEMPQEGLFQAEPYLNTSDNTAEN